MINTRFRSHLVQKQYELFERGVLSEYSALFIRGVIPNRSDFHQQFDLYVKFTPYDTRGKNSVKDGVQDHTLLDKYRWEHDWSLPHQRLAKRGCNDICWCCGKWCVEFEGDEKFSTYACLIGKFRQGNRHHHIREKPYLCDPVDPQYPTPTYPFLCWTCYNTNYKDCISIRFFGHVYVIDHVFVMNQDPYDFQSKPFHQKRILTRNSKWKGLKKVGFMLLIRLNTEGRFVMTETSTETELSCVCAVCGVDLHPPSRVFYIRGTTTLPLPVALRRNGKLLQDQYGYDKYIYACDRCHKPKSRIYYPFGVEFKAYSQQLVNR